MAILVDKRTRLITQGPGGEAAHFHTAAGRSYGHGRKCFVASVNARAPGAAHDGLPIHGSVAEAKAETGANASVIYAPPGLAAAAIDEAIDAELELVVCITEGIPADDMARVRRRLQDSRTVLLGPDSQGVITPGEINVGTLPSQIHRRGRIGVVSRSSALSRAAATQLAHVGLGQSTVVGIGSDPQLGLGPLDVLKLFNDDPRTDAVLLIGEVDEPAARWVADHVRKPVVAYVSTAPHAAAVMQECGIRLTRHPAAMGELLASVVEPQWLPFD